MMLWIALGGGTGALLRCVLDTWIAARVRVRVPVGTLVINLLGSFVLGLLIGHFGHASEATKVLGTGAMGGFTTFSAASVESARLLLAPKVHWAGVVHALGMVIGSVLVAALGLCVGG